MRIFKFIVCSFLYVVGLQAMALATGPITVTKWKTPPKELQLSGDAKSGVLMGWITEESSSSWIGIQRIDLGGRVTWGDKNARVGESNLPKKGLRVLPDHRGGAVIGWREEDTAQSRFLVLRLSPEGTPLGADAMLIIATATTASSAMALDVDEKGRVFLAWEELQSDHSQVFCQEIDEQGHLRWSPGGRSVATADSALHTPAIATDHDGGFFIVWHSSDPMIAMLRGTYIDSKDHVVWGPWGKVIATGMSHPSLHTVLDTTDRELLVVWREQSQAADTWGAQSMDASGRQRWASEGISLNPQEGELEDASVSVDATGKIMMVWEDVGASRRIILAQQWNRKGLTLWDTSGVPVVEDRGGEQFRPVVVSDNSGDPYIFWLDNFDHPWEIYAQRMKPGGRQAWNHGVLVTPAGPFPSHPLGSSDFKGGAVSLWLEQTPDQAWELQALRINSSGASAW